MRTCGWCDNPLRYGPLPLRCWWCDTLHGPPADLPALPRRDTAGLHTARGHSQQRDADAIERAVRSVWGSDRVLHGLDIGCGHGAMLTALAGHGILMDGIDEDPVATAAARRSLSPLGASTREGNRIITGRFPDDSPRPDWPFHVVVLAELLEHVTHPAALLHAIAEGGYLQPGGVLYLTVPLSSGWGYRWATRLARLGYRTPLRRYWQTGERSPHRSLPTPWAVRMALATAGFRVLALHFVPTVLAEEAYVRGRASGGTRVDGLLARVFAARERSVPTNRIACVAQWGHPTPA